LQGLHKKDRFLAFGTCLAEGLTVRESAARCKISPATAFHWWHRFLGTKDRNPCSLTGIVEVDETYVLESKKGQRRLGRKARCCGGIARKPGLSAEQVPVLVAADRSAATTGPVLRSVTANSVRQALEPVVSDVLVTDGNKVYPSYARSLRVRHEALNLSAGQRVRGPFHIQMVNNRHSRFVGFLDRFNGISTKYLANYLRWFERTMLVNASPRSCLASAINVERIRI